MSGRILAILGLAVGGLLVGLWLMIRDDDTTASDGSGAQTKAEPPPAAPTVGSGTVASRARVVPPVTLPRRPAPTRPSAETDTAPALAPSGSDEGSAKPAPTPFKRMLSDQVVFSEPAVAECAEKATKAGANADGMTAVAFTLARGKDGKTVLESTGVEYTTIGDARTTDCIKDIAKNLTFDALPDGADAVTAYRKVVVKDGKVTENWLTEFSIARPSQPPIQ